MLTKRVPGQRMFGLTIAPLTMPGVVDQCTRAVNDRVPTVLGVVNAAKVVSLQQDRRLANALEECDLVLADGQAVVWAGRLLRRRLPERVAGIDLFVELLRRADERRWGVYFLGATAEVLADLLTRIGLDYPNLRVVGAHDGYFPDEEASAVAAHIAVAEPDLLFVGMSSPRKELFLQQFGHRVVRGVAHGVGGSFDVLAGHVKRAPDFWQRCGLEWLYRVLQEPRRLWRRYLFSNAAFLGLCVREWIISTSPGTRARISPTPPRLDVAASATYQPAPDDDLTEARLRRHTQPRSSQ